MVESPNSTIFILFTIIYKKKMDEFTHPSFISLYNNYLVMFTIVSISYRGIPILLLTNVISIPVLFSS